MQATIPTGFFHKDGKRLSLAAYVFLIVLCFAFFIPGIVSLPPTDRDESSFAQASKQMIETGNYVDIRLQDKPRYKKPIGIYWLQSASARLFNPDHLNEIWAYRIPSFVGATATVVLTAMLGSLLFSPIVGLLAALMMVGCVILNVEARLAKTDAMLLATIMAMQYALAKAYVHKKEISWLTFLTFWTALGAGILIKGPIILLVLASTLLWLWKSDTQKIGWFRQLKPWLGLGYLLLIVMPWFVAIALQSHGAFIEQSAGHDFIAKLFQGQDRGILPPGLHLLAFPLVFFPFSIFVMLAIPDSWEHRHSAAMRFCLGWIIPTWIIFELSFTKLPHYTLPVFPALALLAAKALIDGYPVLADKALRWYSAFAIGLWTMIGMGFAFAFSFVPFFADHQINTPEILAAVILVVSQGVCLFLLFERKASSVLVLSFGSLIFMVCTFGFMVPSLQSLWISRQAVDLAEQLKPCDHLQLISSSYGEPSLVFLAGTQTKIIHDALAAANELRSNPCQIALIDNDRKQPFLDAFTNNEIQPAPMGRVTGLNSGHGKTMELTLYLLPKKEFMP